MYSYLKSMKRVYFVLFILSFVTSVFAQGPKRIVPFVTQKLQQTLPLIGGKTDSVMMIMNNVGNITSRSVDTLLKTSTYIISNGDQTINLEMKDENGYIQIQKYQITFKVGSDALNARGNCLQAIKKLYKMGKKVDYALSSDLIQLFSNKIYSGVLIYSEAKRNIVISIAPIEEKDKKTDKKKKIKL